MNCLTSLVLTHHLSSPAAVDDPTQVRIMDISVTPVAKIAFEVGPTTTRTSIGSSWWPNHVSRQSPQQDALKYSISTKGHIESHGGFAHGEGDTGYVYPLQLLFSKRKEGRSLNKNVCGVCSTAMRGMGREPINAWVPLFINAQHWKLVLPQIKVRTRHGTAHDTHDTQLWRPTLLGVIRE